MGRDHEPISARQMHGFFGVFEFDGCPTLQDEHPFIPRLIVVEPGR